jgi:hypothetical protein
MGEAQSTPVCRLFLGPRDSLKAGEFLLRVADLGPESARMSA